MSVETCPVNLEQSDVESAIGSAEYDMDDFDNFYVDQLKQGAVAATTYQPEKLERLDLDDLDYDDDKLNEYDDFAVLGGDLYGVKGEIDFIANKDVYGCLDDDILEIVNDHEARHSKQFRNKWGESEKEYQNISNELADELDYINEHGSLELLEGMTQFVTEASKDKGRELGEQFYPRETEIARKYLEMRGFDLEDEFDEYEGEEFNSELELYQEIEATSDAVKEIYQTDINASMKELEQEIMEW